MAIRVIYFYFGIVKKVDETYALSDVFDSKKIPQAAILRLKSLWISFLHVNYIQETHTSFPEACFLSKMDASCSWNINISKSLWISALCMNYIQETHTLVPEACFLPKMHASHSWNVNISTFVF